MGIQYDILASTLRILRDREVDNTFRTIPLLEAVQRAGNVEQVDGGQKVDHPVILAEHSNITQLATGYESVNLAVKDALRTASFDWCDFVAPVVITEKEQLSNKGPRAIIRIAEARLKSVMGMLKREWCKQTVAGTSTILTDLNTLNGEGTSNAGSWGGIVAADTTGFFEDATFGNQTNTIGGIAKGSFTSSWQNQVADAANNFGNNGLKAMSNLIINTQIYAPEGEVDIILASPISYELYRNELTDQERYTSAEQMKDLVGKMALMYNGAMMYIDPNLGFTVSAAAGGVDKVSMYFLNTKLFTVYFDKDAYFEMGDMERISGYAAASSNIMVRTQLATSHLASQGVLLNGEA